MLSLLETLNAGTSKQSRLRFNEEPPLLPATRGMGGLLWMFLRKTICDSFSLK